jgi:LCP family protein required for cell wall assembly
VLGAGGLYFYVRYRFNQIPKKPCPECVATDDGGQPMTVLMVGSDTRADIPTAEAKAFCERRDCSDQAGPNHSDTIILLHIDPKQRRATVLSIPRDTYVSIAGTTRKDRINTAFATGVGPLILTIKQDFNIDVNHFAVVDFVGFRGIVNSIGGISVYFPAPARDAFSGLNVKQPGCVHLDGNSALSYVRSRHYEYFEAGRWRPDPYSDFSRIQRQQDFIRRVLKKALAVRNPLTANQLLGSAVNNLKIDSKFSEGDMLRLGKRFRSLSPDAVDMLTLPGDPIRVGGADVLRPHQPDADETIKRFLQLVPPPTAGPPSSILPNSVRIRVLNGSGAAGEATSVAKQLQEAGFGVAGTGDADSFRYIAPVIRYGTGQRDKAALLQSAVIGGAEMREDATLRGLDLVLITGSGLKGIRLGSQASGAPSTTAPPANGPSATPGGPPANRGAPPQPQC